jgi:hypothetical protein
LNGEFDQVAMLDWKDTLLWQRLESLGTAAESTRNYVHSWLTDVQILLSKAGTAPGDFTLHDDEHSFRVAQKMVELLPEDTASKLSDFEIGLLLKAAYLHDIGMNPNRAIVQQIREFLLTGNSGTGPQEEFVLLQHWLDQAHPGAQPPIAPDDSIIERLSRAEFLTAYFCRHRHNDWSGNYIWALGSETKQTILEGCG